MLDLSSVAGALAQNWPAWLVTVTLVAAAAIDGWKLKVPNWLTLPMIIGGWIYSTAGFGLQGLGWSIGGTAAGLALLLPMYAIGGMGAGDVKLLAGVGAWVWAGVTFYAFCLSAVIGAAIAVLMVSYCKAWGKHRDQFWMIFLELITVRDPNQLSAMAAERKGSMLLLPYGIPIAIGTILYFAWTGMLA